MNSDPSKDRLGGPTADEPLTVGTQVRAVDSEPVFSSDPKTGDLGEIIQASSNSYLVRWASTAETWMARENLEPVGGVEATPVSADDLPSPVATVVRRNAVLPRTIPTIVFAVVFAVAWIPSLPDAAST